MRRGSGFTVGLALAALALAGCADGTVIETGPATSSPPATSLPPVDTATQSAPPTATPTDATSEPSDDRDTATATAAPPVATGTATGPPSAGIHKFDFLNATMADSWEHREVTLVDGEATVDTDLGSTHYRLGADSIDLVDLDEDGDNDALVQLFAEAGDGWSDYTYAWLWDETTGTAEQVLPALTDDARCGNVTRTIVPADGELVIRYLDRATDEACAEQPATEAQRTVRLEDGYAFQVAPHRTALGHCGEITAEPMPPTETGLPGEAVLAYPADNAPVVATFTEVAVLSLPEASMRTREDRPGWTKVLFALPGQDQGVLERQCGWTLAG